MRNIAAIVIVSTVLAPTAAWAADPREEALALSKQALDAYLAGDFSRSADLYGQAYHTWPSEPLYLYNAGRAAERAEQLAEAERMYQLYLERAQVGQAEVAKAQFHLDEIRATRQAATPRKGARPTLPPTSNKTDSSPGATQRGVGVGLLVAGGVAACGGALLLALADSDQGKLNVRLSQFDAGGQIIGISHSDAVSQQDSINTREYVGWAMLGTGVAAGITGAVLLATAPSARVAVTPWLNGQGAQLAWRF